MARSHHPPILTPDDSVLIVDDEAFSRFMTIELFDRLGTPNIMTARDGREALTVLGAPLAAKVRVVVLDFNMPELNGISVLKAIRSGIMAVPHDVIVFMISSIENLGLLAAAVALDIDAFLPKPASIGDLRRHLTEVLAAERDCWSPEHYAGIDVEWMTSVRMIDTSLEGGDPIAPNDLAEGMVIAGNLFDPRGGLLIAAGTKVTPRLLRLLHGLVVGGLPLDGLRVIRPA